MFHANAPCLAPGDGDAVLFDAAGTLIEPIEPVGQTYAAVAGQFGSVLDPAILARAFGDVFRSMPAMAFNVSSMEALRRLERDWWRTLVTGVLDRAGTAVDEFDAFFDRLYAHYARCDAWRIYPDVPLVLQELSARGCKLAVVSNFDSRLPDILDALGLADRFDAILYSTRAGSAKPDGAIFRQALDILGVTAERSVHVGDSLDADYRGAIAAGITGLLIKRDETKLAVPAYQISSLDALLSWNDPR